MSIHQQLWLVTVKTSAVLAERIAASFADNALAVTLLAPPRQKQASIEILYDVRPERAALIVHVALVAALAKAPVPHVHIKKLPPVNWLKKVAADFPPLTIARWVVHDAQHRTVVLKRRHALQIDATNAFGTGEHPTTGGCLIMLHKMLKNRKPRRMLDMGCGSGILALAYAKATHRNVLAVDLDPLTVRIAQDNVRINGLQKEIRVVLSRGYQSPLVRQRAPYDLIMANIFAGPLSQQARELKHHLRPGGIAILAGLLTSQANKILAAHRMQGIYSLKRLKIGEWTVLALIRPTKAK